VDPRTKALVQRAEQLRRQSYFVRFRAQSNAGLAFVLCREAERFRLLDGTQSALDDLRARAK
jgi:hypothetical protein